MDYIGHHKDQSIVIITPFVNQNKMIQQTLKDLDLDKDISCGTVHAFQGDEKDVILFSTAITDNTGKGTYDWIKNSKELINVSTSRAKNQLIVLSDLGNVERLHTDDETDDLYELINYVRQNGNCVVTPKVTNSRALVIKLYSTKTEETFLKTLNHALENLFLTQGKYTVEKEVAIAHVFNENLAYSDLFYTGRFDFVVYEKVSKDEKMPLLAIELDGKKHYESDVVMRRDQKKNEICAKHNLELIRVENSYARRYNYIKEILMAYFAGKRQRKEIKVNIL